MKRRLFVTGLFTIALPCSLMQSLVLSSGLPKSICPQHIEPLAQLLVRDLPGYANRATIKGRSRSQFKELTYVVIASQPEVEPLDLPNARPNAKPNLQADPNLHQLFITTLERQTLGDRMYEFQQYHWLFLAKTRVGWRLTQSFSRTGRYPQDDLITAPRDSSQAAIAQGIKIWLRDCNAGSIRL